MWILMTNKLVLMSEFLLGMKSRLEELHGASMSLTAP
jgi:hypothetical protein